MRRESNDEEDTDLRKTFVNVELMSMAFEQRKSEGSGSDELPAIADASVNETFFIEAFDYRVNSKERTKSYGSFDSDDPI